VTIAANQFNKLGYTGGGCAEALVIIFQKKNYGIKALAPTLPRVHLIITSLQPKTWPALANTNFIICK
jgi:hypothetical protein